MATEARSEFALEYLGRALGIEGQSSPNLLIPVGGIIYRENRRLIALGDNGVGCLVAKAVDLPEDFDPDNLVGIHNRLLRLNNFEEVAVGQVNLAQVSLNTFESLDESPAVHGRICFQDLLREQDETFSFEEEEILRLLAGETGGIAQFKGDGLPEDIAMVMERVGAEKRFGWVFFFHPKEASAYGMTSVKGAREFFQELNSQFIIQGSTSLQARSIRDLDRNIREGYICIDADARLELFKAQIIANARLAGRTGEKIYTDFLQKHLAPSASYFMKVGELLRMSQRWDYSTTASDAVDRLIFGKHSKISEVTQKQIEAPKSIFKQLKTDYALAIRHDVEAYYGDEVPEMFVYLDQLAKWVFSARDAFEFRDIKALLDESLKWSFRRDKWYYKLTIKDERDASFVHGYDRSCIWTPVENFFSTLEKYLIIQKRKFFIEES